MLASHASGLPAQYTTANRTGEALVALSRFEGESSERWSTAPGSAGGAEGRR